MPSAGLVLVLLVGASAAAEEGAPTTEVTIDAERVLHDGQRQLTTAEGRARLVTEGAALDADRIVYDRARSAATASGHAVLRSTEGGLVAVTADVVTVRFDGDEVREVFLLDGTAVSKKGVTPQALLAARTAAEVRALGTTAMLLQGNHLTRDGSRWTVESIELVPCECNFDQPSWSVVAGEATVDTVEERVTAWFPRVTVHHVPLLWFPWISLPLNDRQTGLLFPKPSVSAQSGFGLELPIFITLGRSADVTVSPGYYSGADSPFGIQGPKVSTELRYTPSARTSGRATLGLLYDTRVLRDPVDSALTFGVPRGLRYEASWTHAQDLGGGLSARVEAAAHSDGYLQRDLVTDIMLREAGYLRSMAGVAHRGEDHLLGVDVLLRQDLSWGYRLLGRTARFENSGAPKYGPTPLQRWPAVELSLPVRRLVGPLAADLHAGFVRLAPLSGRSGDEGAAANDGRLFDEAGVELGSTCLRQRLYLPFGPSAPPGAPWNWNTTHYFVPLREVTVFSRAPALDPACVTPAQKVGQGDGEWQPGEREARDRLSVLPRVWASVQPGGFFSLTAEAAWRQSVWLGEASGHSGQRGYPLLGARLETRLARTGTVSHSITPSVELRAVPFVVGDTPAPYDELDFALPGPGARAQAVAEVRQRLAVGRVEARLQLGQGFELLEPGQAAPRLSEAYGRFSAVLGWLSVLATARLDPVLGRVTRGSAGFSLDNGQGRAVWAGWEHLIDDGTARTRAPMDLLFGTPVPVPSAMAELVTGGARYRAGAVQLRYEAVLMQAGLTELVLPVLVQHTLGVAWAPACDCWRVEIYATHRPVGDEWAVVPDIGAILTVSRFGSIGIAR